MQMMSVCRKRLWIVWGLGFVVLIFLLLLQTAFGRYGDRYSEAWGWFFPTMAPTLFLMIGGVISDASPRSVELQFVDQFMYRLSLYVSVVYLVVVVSTILLSPFSSMTQLELMKTSHLWLGPLQGMVSGIIGFFFVSKDRKNGQLAAK
jgi:hypothetical protein